MHQVNMVEDTHNLENTGMTRPQAEAMVQVIRNSVKEATEPLATRNEMVGLKSEMAEFKSGISSEMAEFKTELKSETAKLRSDNEAQHLETRNEVAALRTELKGVTTELKGGMAKLEGELAKEMAKHLKNTVITVGVSTITIVTALAIALRGTVG